VSPCTGPPSPPRADSRASRPDGRPSPGPRQRQRSRHRPRPAPAPRGRTARPGRARRAARRRPRRPPRRAGRQVAAGGRRRVPGRAAVGGRGGPAAVLLGVRRLRAVARHRLPLPVGHAGRHDGHLRLTSAAPMPGRRASRCWGTALQSSWVLGTLTSRTPPPWARLVKRQKGTWRHGSASGRPPNCSRSELRPLRRAPSPARPGPDASSGPAAECSGQTTTTRRLKTTPTARPDVTTSCLCERQRRRGRACRAADRGTHALCALPAAQRCTSSARCALCRPLTCRGPYAPL